MLNLICFSSLFSLLCASGCILHALKGRLSGDAFTQTKARIRTWGVILLSLFAATLLGKSGLLWFFGLVSYLAFKELVSIVPTRLADRRTLFWAYIAIPIQFILIAKGFYVLSLIFIPVYMLLFLPLRLVLTGETQSFIRSLSFLHWGMMTMVFCLAHAVLLFLPCKQPFPLEMRISTLLFLILLTQANDIAQFLFGKCFGRSKIVPSVSPNKTWAGFIGGVCCTTSLGYCLGQLMTPLSPLLSLGAGLIIGVMGFFGDLTMSALKRDLQIKDTSLMLPGHGGIIDRIDSLIFTAPLFFHYFNFFWMDL